VALRRNCRNKLTKKSSKASTQGRSQRHLNFNKELQLESECRPTLGCSSPETTYPYGFQPSNTLRTHFPDASPPVPISYHNSYDLPRHERAVQSSEGPLLANLSYTSLVSRGPKPCHLTDNGGELSIQAVLSTDSSSRLTAYGSSFPSSLTNTNIVVSSHSGRLPDILYQRFHSPILEAAKADRILPAPTPSISAITSSLYARPQIPPEIEH
jgi:hypothetical protein